MNRLSTQVIKARQIEVSFGIDERDEADVLNLDRLRKEGIRDFGGQRVDVRLTDYLTVHDVIAIEDIQFVKPSTREQQYASFVDAPRQAKVIVKLIIDNARSVRPLEEKLISNEVLELPGAVKALR